MNKSGVLQKKKTIVLTGGGSAGHVIPNLLLLPDLQAGGWDVHYFGSRDGMEASLVRGAGVKYHAIQTGKLRRYFDIKNLTDPFRAIAGVVQSVYLLAKIRPSVIFAKGGFVSAPVVLGGRLLGTPSVIHESDLTQGLANKICAPFASIICLSFEKTAKHLSKGARAKSIVTGAPIRRELTKGDAGEGLRICGFNNDKPVLLVTGGSQGSESLNKIVRSALTGLLESWQVAHICGRGHIEAGLGGLRGYKQFEFVGGELSHLYKISAAAVSRAGANTIFELLYLNIPSVLIPLPLASSRGDQIKNAEEFERSGYCVKLDESKAGSAVTLIKTLNELHARRDGYVKAMRGAYGGDAKDLIIKTICEAAGVDP